MPLLVDVPLADGARLEAAGQSWQVLYTPGHASTQLCLYGLTTQQAITSDHLLPDTTANIVLEPPWPGEPVAHPVLDYLASLRRLQTLPIACVWPGHGPEFTDAAATIAARIERCEQRLEQAAALVSSAPRTAWQVAEAMYAGTAAASSTRALFQVVAYLDALVKLGRVQDADEDGIRRYYPAR
jgi:glyoxylase-like metal-dependent hydrolase (beta-lactamase superfamily II)